MYGQVQQQIAEEAKLVTERAEGFFVGLYQLIGPYLPKLLAALAILVVG